MGCRSLYGSMVLSFGPLSFFGWCAFFDSTELLRNYRWCFIKMSAARFHIKECEKKPEFINSNRKYRVKFLYFCVYGNLVSRKCRTFQWAWKFYDINRYQHIFRWHSHEVLQCLSRKKVFSQSMPQTKVELKINLYFLFKKKFQNDFQRLYDFQLT